MRYFPALAILGLASLACEKRSTSSSAASTATLSCTVSTSSICIDYGMGYTTSTAQASCTNVQGTFSSSAACSTTDRVGSCALTSSGVTLTTRYYSTLYNAAIAEAACTQSTGTFTATATN